MSSSKAKELTQLQLVLDVDDAQLQSRKTGIATSTVQRDNVNAGIHDLFVWEIRRATTGPGGDMTMTDHFP